MFSSDQVNGQVGDMSAMASSSSNSKMSSSDQANSQVDDMSAMASNPITSKNCKSFVLSAKKNNIWFHQGDGIAEHDTVYYKISVDDLSSLKNVPKMKSLPFIDPIKWRQDFVGIYNKPCNCIWFSRGSWLVNPYNERDLDEIPEEELDGCNVFATQNPDNILNVNSLSDLQAFASKYEEKMFDKKTELKYQCFKMLDRLQNPFLLKDPHRFLKVFCGERKIDFKILVDIIETCVKASPLANYQEIYDNIIKEYKQKYPDVDMFYNWDADLMAFVQREWGMCPYEHSIGFIWKNHLNTIPDTYVPNPYKINWKAIRDDGYYGVSFDFCKVRDIGGSYKDFLWHMGFDVESLCVWDLRAFTNMYAIELSN